MLYYILHVLVDAAVIVGLSRVLPQIQVKDFTTAVIVAVLLGLLSFFLGWIAFPLNAVTLFLLRGIVRIVVTALILKLIDAMLGTFNIQGFWPALVIAVAVAVVGSLFDGLNAPRQTRQTRTYQQTSQHVLIASPTQV